ncbi:ATP-binding protein [uncultured Desulfobacter sp.]|uniref:hybrid sensor histidine kinase/response regulator n=1 Tax=uncultured Desulfobacter sp. TaxID=240139 RepID=UPI00259B791C|nr:ATP-binding protein [uncultured Desulfobacter sp.]
MDDEENIRFSFATILTDAGHDAIKAGHLIDAKAILNANQFDVAVIDRLLESHDGMELVKYINKTQPFCTTILMSAFPNFKSASEGFKHNLFAYMQKPVKKDELCNIVETAAQNSKKKLKLHNFEYQLMQAQKMATIGTLTSGIVHDFNNLLMTINGYVDLSLKDPLSKNLTKIRKISEHGENLSNLLLSYIQQTNEKPEHVQIQFLVKKTLAFLQILLPRKIRIREKINKGDDTILAHPVQIQQVIVNLGINAMHAMGNEGGIIEVSLEKVKLDTTSMKCMGIKTRDCIKLSMKDTGCGMDEKTLKQIFKTFYSTREQGKGTGLGLSITHNILENHGGGIKVESLLGKGSTFHVYLPIIDKSHKD